MKTPPRFAATDYFHALPPAGRFPLASIDTNAMTQLYFPTQTNVLLSLVPDDELPALIEDSLSLPPIDLTQPASAYADLAVFMLVPAPRAGFVAKTPVRLTGALPQVLNNAETAGPAATVCPPGPCRGFRESLADSYRNTDVRVLCPTPQCSGVPDGHDSGDGSRAWRATAGAFSLTASVSPESVTGTVTFMDGSKQSWRLGFDPGDRQLWL